MARDRVNIGRAVRRPVANTIDVVNVTAQFDGDMNLTSLAVFFTLEGDETVYEGSAFTPGVPVGQLRREVRRVAKAAAEALG